MKKVYILILNYNNWQDTIECLESVYKSNFSNFQVIVVDNHSTDGSIEHIKKWSQGEINVVIPQTNLLRHLSSPSIKKPFPLVEYNNQFVLLNGKEDSKNLILINSGKNFGFAYGNNIGLKFIQAKNDYEYIYLLNNDTVIEKNTLTNLVEFKIALSKNEKIGMLGSKLLYYDKPDLIQGLGGKYNKFFALASKVGENTQNDNGIVSEPNKIDFVIGAAMLVSRDFLRDVGLMSEEYFIYFEEIDWATRAKKKGYTVSYCPNSNVYHKEGRTTGGVNVNKSELADYFGIKNRIVFTRKFYPFLLPFVYFSFIGVILNRARRFQFDRIGLIFKILFNTEVSYENLIRKNKK